MLVNADLDDTQGRKLNIAQLSLVSGDGVRLRPTANVSLVGRADDEQGAVCNHLGSINGSLNHAHCMGELNPLQGWHEQLRASII